jgi:uncharacterized protein (DUF2164 family)
MSEKKFSREEKERIVKKVETYFVNELDHKIGNFEAEFLIDFFADEIGAYFYNQGLSDAQLLYTEKAEELSYTIQELEKPTN